jgi:hypothetical protein
MSSNYARSINAIKEKNGGSLPSDLYLQTNAQLGKILYDMTGDIKHMAGRTSKEALVKRIEKLVLKSTPSVDKSAGSKRKKNDESFDSIESVAPPTKIQSVKKPRNCLPTLSPIQIVQMKRVLAMDSDQVQTLQHEKDLRPLWSSIGMTAQYPRMTGKEKVMDRLKIFADSNLQFHGLIAN